MYDNAIIPVFDQVGFLDRVFGDRKMARDVARFTVDNIPDQIEELQRRLTASDVIAAGRIAHRLKGAAANIGGEALRAVALEMEQASKTGDLVAMIASLPKLIKQFERLREAVAEFDE